MVDKWDTFQLRYGLRLLGKNNEGTKAELIPRLKAAIKEFQAAPTTKVAGTLL
jgi:hypothetical protein